MLKINFVLLGFLSAVMWSADSAHRFSYSGPLTGRSSEPPRTIAEQFLRSEARTWGLDDEDIAGAYIAKEYATAHNGVTHFVLRQQFGGVDVLNAVWKINIDSDGRVINSGGRLAKRPQEQAPSIESGSLAVRAAVREVNAGIDGSYLAGSPSSGNKALRFLRGGFGNELEGQPIWYQVRGRLRPAWLVTVPAANGVDRYITIVDAASQKLLGKDNLTRYYQAQPPPRGLVFERESPQPRQTQGVLSTVPRPYVQRTVQPFTGDSVASPKGWVDGTATIGNNVIAGHNPTGQFQLRTPTPAVASDGNFSFPLELGPGAPNPTNFKDAATTNLFYWVNRIHDRFYAIGFDEAAGNFQQDNFGRGGVPGDAILAFSQYGIAAPTIAALDNAFYTSNRSYEDGSLASINMYLSGSFQDRVFTDGSYDAEVITHEYTHGVVDRLVQDAFGLQVGAMHEGWADYFALEFTLPDSAPPDGPYAMGEYMFQRWGNGSRSRPYSTNLDVNPVTFAHYGRISGFGPEVHFDGEIWFMTLWEARANLIRQFGDREGRRRMAVMVLDAMKLLPPQASMIDARDALLLADRVGFRGESASPLWAAFAKRGLGTTAFSASNNVNNVTASFDPPSNTGVLRFEHSDYVLDETVRLILHDANNTSETAMIQLTSSSGDLENLVLRRQGDTFFGTARMGTDGVQVKFDSYLDVIPGDFMSAYYVDANADGGSTLIETTVPSKVGYRLTRQAPAPAFVSGTEAALFTIQPGGRFILGQSRVTLPFPFQFYGRQYRTIWVSGSGYIAFDTPSFLDCSDERAAAEIALVAPMWMELAYGGAGQSNENVYYSSGPGSVTVRWAAETVETGEPVNFSLVLYEDGRMLFQYGNGNTNLVSSARFGCDTQTPFIGLSNGRGTFVQTFEDYEGLAFLRQAPPVLVEPPFNHSSLPVVRIETPEAGKTYAGVLTVRGIAYDPDAAIARLDLIIDGVPRRVFALNQDRTDFCATQRVRDCPRVGFSLNLDVAAMRLAPGEHTLQILATNSRGAFQKFPDQPVRFNVEAGQSRQAVGAIEVPVEGATLSATTTIRGWAYAPDLRITAVDVIINGATYGQAQYGLRRDDVCNTLTERPPNCPNVGFSLALNTIAGRVQLPNGESFLQVRARDESGRFTLIPETPIKVVIENETSTPPEGVLLNPGPNQRLSGIVNIWGWAWDDDGTIRAAELLVDGIPQMVLGYGDERAAQCANLPNVAACPNIGFWGDFDTRRVPNGLHLFSVRLRDDKGRTKVIPQPGGVNVFVQND